ncbi:MAG: aldo/keto reductase [Chloroflexi bacterium]|nr:aldo/keto reductase [Chloroflexota bacterium]
MQKRTLGRSGIEVSAVGVGCWAMGGSGWGGGADDAESIRALHKALEMGVNFFDTADIYGMGRSEKVLGEALSGRRDGAVIATKFTYSWDDATKTETGPNTSPEYIRSACEASLRRLQTDYIDLYQFHWNEYGPEGAEEVRDTLEGLVAGGKIRTYGWSTDFSDRARIFAEGPNCSAIQVEMNVIDDAPDILAVCDEFNLAAINRGPLAMGLLTGKYTPDITLSDDDVRGPNAPEWMKYFKDGAANPEWLDRVTAVREILQSDGRTLAQGALAWLWARSDKTLPIPGFRTTAQVEENCAALKFGPLTADQMVDIDRMLGRVSVK